MKYGQMIITTGSFQYIEKENNYMITLVRWISLKQKEVKHKLAFYTLLDKTVKEFNAGELKDKLIKEIMPYLAELVHATAQAEKNKTK